LRHELGTGFDEERARHYLTHAPRMVDFFRQRTALQFTDGNLIPDFHGRAPHAAAGGRSVCAAAFDGRRLGRHIRRIKPPLRETTLWGLGIASGAELRHFLQALRAWPSLRYVSRLLLGHGRDLLLHRRSMRLVNGNALVAALVRSALDLGVTLRTEAPVIQLLKEDGRVCGGVVRMPQGELTVRARRGVVLACGGFPHDQARRQQLLPHAPTGREHWSAASAGNTGDGLRLGESAGGTVARDLLYAAAMAPVSLVPRADGSTAHFPHLIERAKPGLIAVTCEGLRFGNEADSYHDLMQALLRATAGGMPEAWLVCDHRFIRRYGLGAAKPAPLPLTPWLHNGYLQFGHTVAELAQACGIAAQALQATVARYNALAMTGRDEDFAKGETAYNRIQGDPSAGHANPCMAPLEQGPFYAVRIVMGSLGTFAGLRTSLNAQVLDEHAQAVERLYAGGNDMNSMMAGRYPSGGITLGPAMTFGYLAAHHAAGVDPSHTPLTTFEPAQP
jgi:succinate dehydrogenase/fumarate reductase flavoprotein subunit